MAKLPVPVELQDGPYKATATDDHFGMRGQRWADPPLDIHRVLGVVDADGMFTPINGSSADGKHISPQHAHGTIEEMDKWLAIPEVQVAHQKLGELYTWIVKGRPADGSRPAFLA